MLSPIQAFDHVNSAIQSSTGYSFSLSNIPQNINKVALPIIALAAGMYISTINADPSKCYGRDFDGDCENFCRQDCSNFCNTLSLEPVNRVVYIFSQCVRFCQKHCIKDN